MKNPVTSRRAARPVPRALALLVVLATLAPPPAPTVAAAAAAGRDGTVRLHARGRVETAPKSGVFEVVARPLEWDARRTAVVVVDVWDTHSCKSATRRLDALVPRMNKLVGAMRDRGALIVHAPSDTMKHYEGTPHRALAKNAPAAPVPAGVAFKWNYLDPAREGPLPIDDSDGGCDCATKCEPRIAWKSEHPGIEIKPGDAVSDQGREIFNLLEQRGVRNVMVLGVHTNMCILGRSFGIRQMTRLGKNVVLVRDLTDTMYDPRRPPHVAHDRGTALVIEHVEKFWCPTILASDVLGDAKPPRVVLVAAEHEYASKETLPAFAKAELEKRGMRCTVLEGDDPKNLPGLDALDDADLLVLFARRRTLPDAQLAKFKKHFDAGKPVVGLRTASHAFQNYLEFDKLVLGGNYQGHHGKTGDTRVTIAEGAAGHPLLRGVAAPFTSNGSLYKNTPLAKAATPLLTGRWADAPPEPVAWTHAYKGGRVFYTSLGHPDDFNTAAFRRLLLNGILWALDEPIPAAE